MSVPDRLVGKTLADDYIIETRLGVGGFGAVYAVRHLRTGRAYAIKVLRPDRALVTPGAQARFRREAKALSSLGHVGIVAIHDYGHEDGLDFIVMDLLEGESLQERLEKGPLTVDHSLRIFDQLADALEAAHQAGFVHRDLKPANIFLQRRPGENERAVLLDFGLARDLRSDATALTGSGEALGTPQYMAPEQAAGDRADARTDIYALGTVLYEMLSGRAPFQGPTPAAVLLKLVTEPPPPLDTQTPVPDEVKGALDRALAKDPNGRPDSIAELRRLMSGKLLPETRSSEPVRVAQSSTSTPSPASVLHTPATRISKPSRRRSRGFAVAGVALVGALVLAWVWTTSSREGPEPEQASAARSPASAEPTKRRARTTMTPAPEAPAEAPEAEPDGEPSVGAPPLPPPGPRTRRSSLMSSTMEASAPTPSPAPSPQPAPTPVPMPAAAPSAGSGGQTAELQQELAEVHAALVVVERVRSGLSALARGDAPAFCQQRPEIAPSSSSYIVPQRRRVREIVSDACEPFGSPDRETMAAIRELPDKLRAARTMALDRSISTNTPASVADDVVAAIDELSRAAANNVSFPCDHPALGRLRRLASSTNVWAGEAASRANRAAAQICSRLGTSSGNLQSLQRRLETSLDSAEGSLHGRQRNLQLQLSILAP